MYARVISKNEFKTLIYVEGGRYVGLYEDIPNLQVGDFLKVNETLFYDEKRDNFFVRFQNVVNINEIPEEVLKYFVEYSIECTNCINRFDKATSGCKVCKPGKLENKN